MAEEARRYRFGPLERRGLVGSLRTAQVFVLAASLTTGVLLMRLLPGAGFLAALGLVAAAILFCFWPIAGRAADEWLPIAGRFTARRARGRNRHLSTSPQAGVSESMPQPVVSLAGSGSGSRAARRAAARRGGRRRQGSPRADVHRRARRQGLLLRTPRPGRAGGAAGRLGRRALEPRPRGKPGQPDPVGRANRPRRRRRDRALPRRGLGPRQRAARVAGDAVVPRSRRLGADGHEGPRALRLPPDRRQARLAPDEARRRQGRRGCGRLHGSASRARVPRRAARRSRRARRRRATAGDGRERAPRRLRSRGLDLGWPASRRPIAIATGSTKPPPGRSPPRRPGRRTGATAPSMRPTGSRAGRARRSERPSSPLSSSTRRWFARSPSRSSRSRRCARSARWRRRGRATSPTGSFAAAWASWRRPGASVSQRRRSRREEELADGHAAVRFAGYVTVSAQSDEELERHCSEVEHAAQMARLELLRLYGQQEEAFTYTLPLCRGLR